MRLSGGDEAVGGHPLKPLPATTDQGTCELGVEQEDGRRQGDDAKSQRMVSANAEFMVEMILACVAAVSMNPERRESFCLSSAESRRMSSLR